MLSYPELCGANQPTGLWNMNYCDNLHIIIALMSEKERERKSFQSDDIIYFHLIRLKSSSPGKRVLIAWR